MINGAREANPSRLRRLVSAAVARELAAFVVPGSDVVRACGLDLEAAGLETADTPRHASVLVLVGQVPAGLKKVAAVAYAQMPRPRAILAVGAADLSPLPAPDVSVALGQEDLARGVAQLRRSLTENAFGAGVPDFDVEAVQTETEYVCPMHPEVVRSEPGSCPICGMDLVRREAAGDHSQMNHGPMDHERSGHGGMDHGAVEHSETQHSAHGQHDHANYAGSEQQEHSEHGGHGGHSGMAPGEQESHAQMDHGHMNHGDMGFMSMVEMTKDLPRSSDGLPMEWIEAPFGPLFPGLPGGLALTFTLDGDTVAGVEVVPGIEGWSPTEGLTGPVEGFADGLALVDPLSPVSYRVLAWRAVEGVTGAVPSSGTALARVGALERERAASHLGWLAGFAHLLGYSWLERRAGELQLALLRAAHAEEAARLAVEAGKFSRRVERTPLLRRKLRGIAPLPDDAEASGPVARGDGWATDTRAEEEAYLELGFEPVVRDGNDALSRLQVRLAEIERSLELVRKAGSVSAPAVAPDGAPSGAGTATVETPRGAATLRVTVYEGAVSAVELDTPSTRHLKLVGPVSEQRELADALVGVASLDLSPWEVVG